MQNKFYILYYIIFKKPSQVFRRKPQKFYAIKTRIYSLIFLLFLQTIQLSGNIRKSRNSPTLLHYVTNGVAIENSHEYETISLFSDVYLFVFRNDYEINDVSFSFFILKNFNPHHETQWKNKLSLFQQNYLHSIHLIVHDLKTRFSRKEILKKCTNFEEQKDKRYIRGKVYFDIIAFSCRSSTKLSQFFFFFFCIVDKDSIRFREEVSLISWT